MLGIAAIGERAGNIAEIERCGRAVGADELNALQRIEAAGYTRVARLPVIKPPMVAWDRPTLVAWMNCGCAVGAAIVSGIVDQGLRLVPGTLAEEEGVRAVGIAEPRRNDMAAVTVEVGAIRKFAFISGNIVLPGVADLDIGLSGLRNSG